MYMYIYTYPSHFNCVGAGSVVSSPYYTVADLGFHEGGFVMSGALARPRKVLKPRPFT